MTGTTECRVCGESTKDNPWNTGHCLKHWQELLSDFQKKGGILIEF